MKSQSTNLTVLSLEKYHPVVLQIINLLSEHKIWHETFTHEPVRTSEEAASLRDGYTLQQGAKTILIRVKISSAKKRFAMLVMPGDTRFDSDKVKELFHAKDIRFATEAEVLSLTNGVQPGGVPPFGNLFGIEVIVDPTLLENEKIIFNAGDRCFSVGMKSVDYAAIVSPRITEIV